MRPAVFLTATITALVASLASAQVNFPPAGYPSADNAGVETAATGKASTVVVANKSAGGPEAPTATIPLSTSATVGVKQATGAPGGGVKVVTLISAGAGATPTAAPGGGAPPQTQTQQERTQQTTAAPGPAPSQGTNQEGGQKGGIKTVTFVTRPAGGANGPVTTQAGGAGGQNTCGAGAKTVTVTVTVTAGANGGVKTAAAPGGKRTVTFTASQGGAGGAAGTVGTGQQRTAAPQPTGVPQPTGAPQQTPATKAGGAGQPQQQPQKTAVPCSKGAPAPNGGGNQPTAAPKQTPAPAPAPAPKQTGAPQPTGAPVPAPAPGGGNTPNAPGGGGNPPAGGNTGGAAKAADPAKLIAIAQPLALDVFSKAVIQAVPGFQLGGFLSQFGGATSAGASASDIGTFRNAMRGTLGVNPPDDVLNGAIKALGSNGNGTPETTGPALLALIKEMRVQNLDLVATGALLALQPIAAVLA
ncbi:hypothetical protein DFS34DRAFT_638934 [Phlyctochytrium arcticum]|nr:hypothetical protein DFS34DRAFT_638934 [Phlyctochytrium arcticum]